MAALPAAITAGPVLPTIPPSPEKLPLWSASSRYLTPAMTVHALTEHVPRQQQQQQQQHRTAEPDLNHNRIRCLERWLTLLQSSLS
ncbi:hypothetical protein LY78DRAFT_112264 [Colletotrichum sublineola]|nr:hypothetical protein LY78DRAFT_112264 [Colletotrichum sublineola]